MKYTVSDLRVDFPDEDACLTWLVDWLYPNGITCKKCEKVTKHYKVTGRRCYACSKCGSHVYPTAGTVFHNSHVPLSLWYHAFYLMSTNKAGTPATQIQREIGVTYKTAWRMMHQIRKMMTNPNGLLSGEAEADESYLHANVYKRSSAQKRYGRTGQRAGQVIFGIVERGGPVKVWQVKTAGARILKPLIRDNVKQGTLIHTDGYTLYDTLPKMGYEHRSTNHGEREFYTPDSHTQNIENFWSTWKPRMKGTYRTGIGPKYLQNYLNEYAWRYSHRNDVSMFWSLMCGINNSKEPV